jgi:hypothetical protein
VAGDDSRSQEQMRRVMAEVFPPHPLLEAQLGGVSWEEVMQAIQRLRVERG